ncbi:MAG: amino acid ABC transporter permease [Oscillospiraceae bacterium]|jgi:His/Glu/Gln/Arg/opine family amino acid ABC transporter permease subunit|nr:amino acid ABC transporter permease [Oscillospiraceae bacterium]
MSFNLDYVQRAFPQILSYLPVTLAITFSAEILALLSGLGIAMLKRRKIPVVRQIIAVFASYCRAVPTLVQLFVAIFLFPKIVTLIYPADEFGTLIPGIVYAVITLGMNHGSFISEIFGAAFDSIDNGQTEAAYSVGMTKFQTLKRIVLPQAAVVALPNLTSLFLSLVQETSLAAIVGVREITSVGINLADLGYDFLETYIILTLIYEVCSFVFGRIFRTLERRVGAFKYRAAASGKRLYRIPVKEENAQ